LQKFICSVVIPTIKINSLLIYVVKQCLLHDTDIQVIVVSNEPSSIFDDEDRISLVVIEELNMSVKRNIGVEEATTDFIAFIDSDAYPAAEWIINGIKILSADDSIGIVSGPELSFPDQTFFENCVGFCNQSSLITGAHSFRKSLSESRFFSEASSCNMVMRKIDYQTVSGMNVDLYVGEDKDLSDRIVRQLGKKIFFSRDVAVFHRDRGFKSFMIQRYARGVALNSSIKLMVNTLKKNFSAKTLFEQRLEFFIPPLFILYLFTLPLTFIFDFWHYFYFAIFAIYLGVLLLQSIFLVKQKVQYLPAVCVCLLCGTIIPGIAQILNFCGINYDISSKYRNLNDEQED
jgi:glycosyltransferase involved in cell wall biosynthesis